MDLKNGIFCRGTVEKQNQMLHHSCVAGAESPKEF